METIIQFRSLLDSLKPSEYHSFLETVTNIFKKDINLFGYTMFNLFMEQLNSEEETASNLKAEYLNDIMIDLIEQRQTEKLPNKIDSEEAKKDISTAIESINEVPNHIIQHISYFLSFKDHTRFENCNRKLFVAARTPSLVYCLGSNDRWLSLYMWQLPVLQLKPVYNDNAILRRKKISINRFKHVHKLNITKQNAKYFSLRKWNNVKELKMGGITSKICKELKNCINWDGITKLEFVYSESKAICNVLNHCSNLVDFYVWNSDINYFDASNMSESQMKLKSVLFSDLRGSNTSNAFAEYILKQNNETLETVSFGRECHVYLRGINSIKFKKIKNLSIGSDLWEKKGVLLFISNCIMLETLIITLDEYIENEYERPEHAYHNREISNLIEIMIKSVTLRNIIFNNNHKDYFSMIVEHIEKHLVSKRKFLSLHLNFTMVSEDDLVSLKRLVHCLDSWCLEGFSLKLDYWPEEIDEDLEERCSDWMQEMKTCFVVKGELEHSGTITIKKTYRKK